MINNNVCITYDNTSALKREDTKWTEGQDIWWQHHVYEVPLLAQYLNFFYLVINYFPPLSINLRSHISFPKLTNATLVGVYALISFAAVAFVYVKPYLTALLGLKAFIAFFSSFTTAIFNAPMVFFDSTPVGRILTRASSDLSNLDFDIPYSITFVACVAIEILVMICIMVSVT
ncbi:ABC transporter C family member 8-like [Trifolium pratense]|uniref:ABC transporter C family member 8-like n=1 Tax=Trifolium pratense TaxID=57577 RepID=UPI001E691278|nr:ABC transporter C family member 8-like [Trifolium pratense]XP_045830398.1 ABC transporter C family member 8-like [Trifolium pratense]